MGHYESIDDLLRQKELGTTGWQLIDQRRIDAFAELSGDHQWIHVDPDRAREEGPFGGTVAHGALTLSLCTAFLTELVQVRDVTHVVNVGFDRVRFRAPVPVGSRLRGAARLVDARRMAGGARVRVLITAEIEGATKPACLAEQILAFYG
ncbi:dehydratase [Actinoplanes sp. ATCC 53533]|uniref:MaoC family dehydratase n=1 Tax=Actinoplanes sp. ATCC 53533 TaxID=1288362 RepID=UPI000F7829B4|nr:MaoC family dehydratase [Actinoplanes sp. ATCC 53533]RSM43139.1 dehydratase [Actinoplanes sp. ATCC 53533]